jgi:uncharacterized paraquat-inducible protein A
LLKRGAVGCLITALLGWLVVLIGLIQGAANVASGGRRYLAGTVVVITVIGVEVVLVVVILLVMATSRRRGDFRYVIAAIAIVLLMFGVDAFLLGAWSLPM